MHKMCAICIHVCVSQASKQVYDTGKTKQDKENEGMKKLN